ncbi:YlzJ-like family protein [Allobacillus sp. GCM10007491]|uniref:YlzJ-like protein n=1 Tax=Allobacillus saliphilus TaxID=2912308 RepID=A0A941CUT3_9BACI|nr:YlzJ-like family protein [Allobacillus saliphilus]MBR7552946.1 hypothetical protein [Allobacillus saliphilus]
MIHYTPLTYEEIFEEEKNEQTQWVSMNHMMVRVRKKADLSGYEIDQMISTDPNDYLNQQLMPGTNFYL